MSSAAGVEISIVIPCHNAAATLDECLAGIRKSTFKDYEIVVVDDASTDSSASICLKFDCVVLSNETNRGPSVCRNRGVSAAKGEVIVLMDADVLISPDALDRIRRFFRENPEAGILQGRYSDTCYFKNVFSRYKNYKLAFRELSRPGREVAFINTSLVSMRKSVFDRYRFDEDVRRAEDSLFGWKYYRDGNRIILDNDLQAIHMKKYTPGSFLRYQFRSGRDLLMNWIHRSMGSAILSESNSLSNRLQLLRAPLSVLLLLALASIPFIPWTLWGPAIVVLLFLAIALQLDYLRYVLRVDGPGMAAASVAIYLLDGFVSALGVGWGLLLAAFRRPRKAA